jgi:putative sigma-54 modulation protein
MQINFTGHHVDVTPAIRNYTTEKFERLKPLGDKITSVNVIFDVEKIMQIAKATLHVSGAEIHARSESEDLYSAIDLLVDKLKQQMTKHKEKQKDHHRDRDN